MSVTTRMLVIAVTLIWGINFVIIKWGLEDMDPMTMTVLRFVFTSVPLVFFINRPTIAVSVLATYGICFGAGIWGLVNLSIGMGVPSGVASLLLQSSAFFTILVAVVCFKEKLSLATSLGIGAAFIGFALVLIYKGGSVSLAGMLLVILAAAFWTLCNVIIKLHKPDNVVSFIAWSGLFVPLPILFLSFGQDYYLTGALDFGQLMQMPSAKAWVSILFQSYVTTLFGYGVWTWAIGKHGLANVAPFSLLVPVAGLLFGWLLYGETLSVSAILGVALILLGLMLISNPNMGVLKASLNENV